jgi:hypothetical protein
VRPEGLGAGEDVDALRDGAVARLVGEVEFLAGIQVEQPQAVERVDRLEEAVGLRVEHDVVEGHGYPLME